jgi:hypothetical protein
MKSRVINPAVRIYVVRGAEINRVDLSARHERAQGNGARTLDIERLQFLWRECHELAALVLVALRHFVALNLLAGMRIMGTKRHASCWPGVCLNRLGFVFFLCAR